MKVLVHGALLQCDQSKVPSRLKVLATNVGLVGDAPLATTQDFKPGTNIDPFGFCAALGQACAPATLWPWTNPSSDVEVNGLQVLTEASKCACQRGGTIQSKTAGQDVVEIIPPVEG